MAVSLIAVTFIGFIVIELPPGSYLETYIMQLRQQGASIPQEQLEGLERRYGLHDPVYIKFYKWVSGFVRGDFGESFALNLPVSKLIWDRLGLTLALSVLTLMFSWIVAIVVGVYSATHRYTMPDYLIAALQFTGLSVPAFLLALVAMVFSQQVLGMSVGGLVSRNFQDAPWTLAKVADLLKHLWIPIVVIGASGTAWLSRVMRGNLLDVLNMQYVQTARAKGLTERVVIWKHAVRNAMHPLVMALGMSFPGLVSGETVVAIVLNLPTVGPIFFRALLQQDMYLAGTILIFLAFMLLVGNLFADILLAWLDPRIRFH